MKDLMECMELALIGRRTKEEVISNYQRLFGNYDSTWNLDDFIYNTLTNAIDFYENINSFYVPLMYFTKKDIDITGDVYSCKDWEWALKVGTDSGLFYCFSSRVYKQGSSKPVWLLDGEISDEDYAVLVEGFEVPDLQCYLEFFLHVHNIHTTTEDRFISLRNWIFTCGIATDGLINKYFEDTCELLGGYKTYRTSVYGSYIVILDKIYEVCSFSIDNNGSRVDNIFEVRLNGISGFLFYDYDMLYYNYNVYPLKKTNSSVIKRKLLL